MSGLQWTVEDNEYALETEYVLETKTIKLTLSNATTDETKWLCQVHEKKVKRNVANDHTCKVTKLIGFESFEAKDLEEAKGKAILSAFDLVIAHAFASRHEVAG